MLVLQTTKLSLLLWLSRLIDVKNLLELPGSGTLETISIRAWSNWMEYLGTVRREQPSKCLRYLYTGPPAQAYSSPAVCDQAYSSAHSLDFAAGWQSRPYIRPWGDFKSIPRLITETFIDSLVVYWVVKEWAISRWESETRRKLEFGRVGPWLKVDGVIHLTNSRL